MALYASQFEKIRAPVDGVYRLIRKGDYRLYTLQNVTAQTGAGATHARDAADIYLNDHCLSERAKTLHQLYPQAEGVKERLSHIADRAINWLLSDRLHWYRFDTDSHYRLVHQMNNAQHMRAFYEAFLGLTDDSHDVVWPEVAMMRGVLETFNYDEIHSKFKAALKNKLAINSLRDVCEPVLNVMRLLHTSLNHLLGTRKKYRGPNYTNYAPERFVEQVALTQLMTEEGRNVPQVAEPIDSGNAISYLNFFI